MKFSEMKYERPDLAAVKDELACADRAAEGGEGLC